MGIGAEARHLLPEHPEVDVGGRQNDVAEMTVEVGMARDGVLAERLHGEPGPHGMGQYVDLADVGLAREVPDDMFEGIARGRGGLPIRTIAEETPLRRPREQDRNAIEAAIRHDLGQAEPRFVEPRVEAVNEEQNVSVRADPARDMGGDLVAERRLVEHPPR